jgi:hypothetical protein
MEMHYCSVDFAAMFDLIAVYDGAAVQYFDFEDVE